jgi:hypothetical protein
MPAVQEARVRMWRGGEDLGSKNPLETMSPGISAGSVSINPNATAG